jgi:EGF-like domain
MRRCPGGNDPNTAVLTRNCNATATPGIVSTAHPSLDVGAVGNLCLAECSNRGICDYSKGQCSCFEGYYGEACDLRSALATYPANSGKN